MATASELIIFQNSTMAIEMRNFRDEVADALVTGATATFRVLDASDVEVTGITQPVTMTEVSGSQGLYRGFLLQAANLSSGDRGTVEVTMIDGTGKDERTIPYVVKRKRV